MDKQSQYFNDIEDVRVWVVWIKTSWGNQSTCLMTSGGARTSLLLGESKLKLGHLWVSCCLGHVWLCEKSGEKSSNFSNLFHQIEQLFFLIRRNRSWNQMSVFRLIYLTVAIGLHPLLWSSGCRCVGIYNPVFCLIWLFLPKHQTHGNDNPNL